MKTAPFAAAAVAIAALAGTVVFAQPAAKKASYAPGYLSGAAIPDMIRVMPAAPAEGSPREIADREIFKATRSLQDSPRWKLAQSDNDMSIKGILAAFRCAIGIPVNRQNAPRLAALLDRVSTDVYNLTAPPKKYYHRERPFLRDQGPVCVVRPDTPDYPSSHSTFGWVTGSILAEMMPDRATELMTRGRSFGESRIVCGVHNASAVEGGRVAGAALVASLNAIPEFRAGLDAVKTELATLRRNPPAPPSTCAAEAALIANTPY
jgi:acid phosphatase (class A)